jgi:Orn/Lys/Arg decarboxylase, C-terminal domain.
MGLEIYGDEPLKLTIDLRHSDIDGNSLKKELREKKIICEYGEPDFVVTMWSPFNEYPVEYDRFKKAVAEAVAAAEKNPDEAVIVAKRDSSNMRHKRFILPKVVYQPYETLLMNRRIVKVNSDLEGEIAADNMTGCPPAITPIIAGEKFNRDIIDILEFYGVEEIGILM